MEKVEPAVGGRERGGGGKKEQGATPSEGTPDSCVARPSSLPSYPRPKAASCLADLAPLHEQRTHHTHTTD